MRLISQGGDGSQVSSRGFDPHLDEPVWPSLPIPVALPQHPIPSSQSAVGQGQGKAEGGSRTPPWSCRGHSPQPLSPRERPYCFGPRGVVPPRGFQEKRISSLTCSLSMRPLNMY